MNADQMEIPLPAPVLHALTEEAKKFGLSCEEYLKKIVIGIMKDELEKKNFMITMKEEIMLLKRVEVGT